MATKETNVGVKLKNNFQCQKPLFSKDLSKYAKEKKNSSSKSFVKIRARQFNSKLIEKISFKKFRKTKVVSIIFRLRSNHGVLKVQAPHSILLGSLGEH